MRSAVLLATAALLVSLRAGAANEKPPQSLSQNLSLEVAARLDLPPAHLTITPEGRKFISLHPFFQPVDRVAEITGENTIRTFPVDPVDSVLGIRAAANGIVWMLDNGWRSKTPPKLVAWESATGKIACSIDLTGPAVLPDSLLSDLAVDPEHHALYIADPASGANAALIVVDLNTLAARRVLKGAACVVPEDVETVVDGQPVEILGPDGTPAKMRVGVQALALGSASEWLYFGPMNGGSLYRVRTQSLLDKFLEPKALEESVERYSDKPVSGGLAIDPATQQIYLGDVGANGIGVIGSDRKYTLLARDPKLRWPDSVAIGPDGVVYVVASQLQCSPPIGMGKAEPEKPFLVFRLVASSPAVLPEALPAAAAPSATPIPGSADEEFSKPMRQGF